MKLSQTINVSGIVDKVNTRTNGGGIQSRFVKVAPPTVHAGIGNALRQAYQMDETTRSLEPFDDLLAKLR